MWLNSSCYIHVLKVGHVVARHAAEGITKNLWFTIIQLIVYQFIALPDVVNTMSQLFLSLPFSRRYISNIMNFGFNFTTFSMFVLFWK